MPQNDVPRSMKDKQLKKARRIAGVVAGFVLLFGFVVTALVSWLGYATSWMRLVGYVLITIVFMSFILVLSLSSYENKGGFLCHVYKLSFWIVQVTILVIELLLPSLLFIIGFLFVVVLPYSIIYVLLKLLPETIGICDQTILFLSLSLSSIISTHYSKPFFAALSRLLMSNGHAYEKYFKELVVYVYQPANIEFGIYFLYVLYLIIYTICRFQKVNICFLSNGNDIAILTSFLVFIAFSNMKTKHKASQFSFSDMFRMMYGIWSSHEKPEN